MRGSFVDHLGSPWQASYSQFYRNLLRLGHADPDHRQWKPEPQFVLEEDLHMMQPKLLKLHPAKVMDVRGVPFHLLELELHFRLRQHLLLVHADNPRFLPERPGAAAPARPDAKLEEIDRQGRRGNDIDHAHQRLHAVDLATDI